MAKSKETTTKFKVDISELKSNLQEAINALSHKDFETANQVVKTRSRKIAIAIADSILG